jgi:phosphatidylglycerophosphate synthase
MTQHTPQTKRTPTVAELAVRPDFEGTWYQRLIRRLAAHVTQRLMDTSITPNQVTITAIVLTVLPAYLLFQESIVQNVIAVVIVYCINILDKVDGQLARAKNLTSRRGIFLDGILHNVSVVAIYGPLGARWFFHHNDPTALFMAIGSIILVLLTSYNYLNRAFLVASNPSSEKNKLGISDQLRAQRLLVTIYSIPSQHFPELLILALLLGAVPMVLVLYFLYNAITFVTTAYIYAQY